jgi:serine/threonine-protein kinase
LVGTSISHYKVTEKIGEGGMGEVYRATDTKLNRDVALKILPEQFASDAQRMGRFQREAEVLASLDHPNIGQIYGIEEAGATKALVLQLIEGPTLAEKIAQGPIPIEEALKIALQIAEGLEAAHEKGVIHRDLKPANIKVTPEGQVKILDFGLAKALEGEAPDSSLSQSPTLTNAATQAGVILGTAAYMSPEQAKGKPVDKRADIFAFGAVLYECLTGRRAFEGEDVSDTLASILLREPDWESLPDTTPWRVQELLRRCLHKDAHDRLHDIADARIDMKLPSGGPLGLEPLLSSQAPFLRRGVRWAFIGGFAVIILLAAALVGLLVQSQPELEGSPGRFVVDLASNQRFVSTAQSQLAVSSNGKQLVYAAASGGLNSQLYLRTLDQFEARPIPGTEGAAAPFFSPDDQWIGFVTEETLKKVSPIGEALSSVCEETDGIAAIIAPDWGENGLIVFGGGPGSGLWEVSASGGEPQQLTVPDAESGEGGHEMPHFLPGGEALLFTVIGNESNSIWAVSLESGERKNLLEGSRPWYVPTGHMVYERGGSLHAVPFDIDTLQVVGSPTPLAQKLRVPSPGFAEFAISDNGTLVYVPGSGGVKGELMWMDRQGKSETLGIHRNIVGDVAREERVRISPDGQRVALAIQESSTWHSNIWIYDVARGTMTPLTFDGRNGNPVWSPDGARVAFEKGGEGISWMPWDGSGEVEQLVTPGKNAEWQLPSSFSPDGKLLAFVQQNPRTEGDILMLSLEGEHEPRTLVQGPFHEEQPMFSPDGQWLAYVSDQSGRSEVYLMPYPGPGGATQISVQGGQNPRWSPNDGELLFIGGEGALMSVSITTQPELRVGTPRALFDLEGTLLADIAPDGERLLMIREEESGTQINVILNWFEELKERVPTN